ncbi:hypothetical protein [Nocardia sp. NPDC005745]|uniref:hypothetical protein n=1 Tax=Nocardia sp. NPDC005745 TaxID=3157061 RepID=UPI0033E2874E
MPFHKRFVGSENKVIREPSLINPALEVSHGDLLLSRANTVDLVGIACIARNPRPRLLLSDKSLRLNINKEVAVPEFVEFALTLQEVRNQIQARATGTSGSMKNISQEDVRRITLPVPRIEGQAEVVRAVGAADKKIASERALLDKLKLLKGGLMEDLLTGRVRVVPGRALTGQVRA